MKKLNVGLIGCGAFVRAVHVPNLKESSKYNIYAAMDISEDAARDVAGEVNAEYWTTDLDRILNDEHIDVVFITTRHDSHADLTIKAAQAGKHVLCEKPMGLSVDECTAIADAVKKNNIKYTVGYNRGMAPLVNKAKNLLKDLPQKRLIYHRIQAPFPVDNWIHDPAVGGGRFVGEGCHIFDLICELVPADPVSVYAAGGVFLNPEKVKVGDSGIITILFADGSVGTTLIASVGCSNFAKEATEIYCNGKVIYINDFKEMEYFGFENQDKITMALSSQDKGQKVEIDRLADAIINDTASPNGIEQAIRAADISFKAYKSIAEGSVPVYF